VPADQLSADELTRYLGMVFKATIVGKMDPKIATASATVARTMVEIRTAGALEELQAEVETLKVALRRGGAA